MRSAVRGAGLFNRRAPSPMPSNSRPFLGVTMLLAWNGVGGTQRQALKLAQELRLLGIHVSILTRLQPGLGREESIDEVPVHRVGRFSRGTVGALSFLLGSLSWMLRHRHEFRIIHAHNLPTGLTAALLRPLLRKPVIVKLPNASTIEDFANRRFGRLRWFLLRHYVNRFVAVNAEIEGNLRAEGISARQLVRIPNGVRPPTEELTSRAKIAMKQRLSLRPDSRVVTYLGRLIPAKGLTWLLEAWKPVVGTEAAAHLLIVGEGVQREPLQELALGLGIASTVSFVGEQNDIQRFLSVSDVLVLPSQSEGMSNALLEGMSHGLAVIATDVPGNRAVVEGGADGLLIPYGDRHALTAGIINLLRDPELRGRLGKSAQKKVASTFLLRSVAIQYQDLYQELSAQ